jgi:peptide subunit release factor 1 (eRF1)
MIRSTDLQRLMQRPASENPILSVYLDMSVNSDNKRTFAVFLNKQRSAFAELASDRESHHRVPLGAAFERVHRWLDESFDESNRGVALFTEIGGDWFEAFQFPIPVRNRIETGPHPVVAPLMEVLASNPRFGVLLVDREHLRALAVFMGSIRDEIAIAPDALPTPHDVHAGSVATRDLQKRKAEEVRQFFKDFAAAVGEFDRKQTPDAWILLGTTENVKKFRDCLPDGVEARIIHTAHAPVDAPAAELLDRLRPVFDDYSLRERAGVIDLIRDRVRQRHLAVAGVGPTLEQLQEGKIDRLVIARDLESRGAQCTRCAFLLASPAVNGSCPYCGGDVRNDVDLVESIVRMAAQQEVDVEFADSEPMAELAGVGGLLRF